MCVGACAPGYSLWGQRCVQCDEGKAKPAIFAGFVFLAWVYVIVFHRLAQTSPADSKLILYFFQMVCLTLTLAMYLRPLFVQVLLFFGPETGWLAWLGIFNFSIFDILKSGQWLARMLTLCLPH